MKAMRKREAEERHAARQQQGDANQTPLGVKQVVVSGGVIHCQDLF